METMKFIPVRMELKPRMNAPNTSRITGPAGFGAVGRVERPARVDSAEHDRRQCEQGPHDEQVVAGRFSFGNATSLAPSMSGSTKLPKMAGIPGINTRKIITAPWTVNIWL